MSFSIIGSVLGSVMCGLIGWQCCPWWVVYIFRNLSQSISQAADMATTKLYTYLRYILCLSATGLFAAFYCVAFYCSLSELTERVNLSRGTRCHSSRHSSFESSFWNSVCDWLNVIHSIHRLTRNMTKSVPVSVLYFTEFIWPNSEALLAGRCSLTLGDHEIYTTQVLWWLLAWKSVQWR